MKTHPIYTPVEANRILDYFRQVISDQLERLKRKRAVILAPQKDRLYQAEEGMAYHFKPELFIQTGGYTEFKTPSGTFFLKSGEVCVMPKGVPHSERTGNEPTAFENVVMCLYNKTVTLHVAHENAEELPAAKDIFFFRSAYFDEFVVLLNCIAKVSTSDLAGSEVARDGLMTGVFGLLLNMLATETGETSALSNRIFHCHWLIRHQLNQPELSVASLSEKLGCSPNHLSRAFHKEVGEKISSYINRIRLQNAESILRETTLSVKEIAFACGFADPNYFSRQFRREHGMTPNEFRHRLLNGAPKETDPKVVYGDYAEFHYGYDLKNRPIEPH